MATKRSEEASSSTSPCSYHVFLSFRGEDTRKTFTDHLYTALVHGGFRTFRDDDGLERGENIKSELEKAIQESKISIVVFSKNYGSSSWCLDELVMILQRRRTSGQVVLPIFYDVDPSQVRKQTGSFKEPFARHEEKIKSEIGEQKEELMDKVGKWRASLREAADLAGMNLQNQADGHESRFIQKIIKVVGDKLSRTALNIDPKLVGIHSRVGDIQLWLENGSSKVDVLAICGMGGIGKTTIAKFLYNLNFSRFESSSFLSNIRELSKQQDGLLRLQKQLLSDVMKTRKFQINNIDEGIVKIKDAMCCKRVLVVLDDVDKLDQLDAILGMQDWLFPGSKIIITTRRERLLRAHEVCKVHSVEILGIEESLELFSWHAFGKSCPNNDYVEVSKRAVRQCGGLPLAIKVLGSSLFGKSLNVWQSQLQKLEAIPDIEVLERLKISYDTLQDDHDKNLFLRIACFFVGNDKDCTVTILDGCEFYTVVGIENLIDRSLVTIDEQNKLVMHQLLQEMGREIVRQESPKEPGERSILWNHKDSFSVLAENTGTNKTEGLILDMHLLKEDKSAKKVFGVNRKRSLDEFLDTPLLSNLGNSLKKHCFSFLSSHLIPTTAKNSSQVVLGADAFARMRKLKLLQLNHVHVSGPFESFPKVLKWLCWHGFPLKSIPSDFPLDSLAVLDMKHSSLKNVWEGTKCLELLKILDLCHSRNLISTPDFSKLRNLEKLMLKNCASLVKVHESIGCLERLVLLDLEDCKKLRKLPSSLGLLKLLETLVISGCSNLEELPIEMGNFESLTVLDVERISISRLLSTTGEVLSSTREGKAMQPLIQPWLLKPTRRFEISFPRSLVNLSLANCNLSDDAFPSDLSNLVSLRKLNLSGNPICSLPNCISGLIGLEFLNVELCKKLQTIVLHQELQSLEFGNNPLLEKIRIVPGLLSGNYYSLVEYMGEFKLEPVVAVEGSNCLGLSYLQILTDYWDKPKKPLQGCYKGRVFCSYHPGSKVPLHFNFKNIGSSVAFTVPSYLNFGVQALGVCSVFGLSSCRQDYTSIHCIHTIISNTTKGLIWSLRPRVVRIPEADEDMTYLTYWKFENQLEGGDEIYVLVVGSEESFQVKEVGAQLLYREEQVEKSTWSASEQEHVSQQLNC